VKKLFDTSQMDAIGDLKSALETLLGKNQKIAQG
jgi:hypothetical protein